MVDSKSSPETSHSVATIPTAIAVGVVALVVLGAGGVVALGIQAPTASDGPTNAASAPATATPTATPTPTAEDDGSSTDAATADGSSADDSSDDDSSDDGSSDDTSSEEPAASTQPKRPFSLAIGEIENCGRTCRDVTVTLTNNGGDARRGVAVSTAMYAGKTAGQNRVWRGEASIGRLGPGASTTRTERVKVGFVGGAKIKQHGGTVTVETVVRWDGGSVTFTERKQVA